MQPTVYEVDGSRHCAVWRVAAAYYVLSGGLRRHAWLRPICVVLRAAGEAQLGCSMANANLHLVCNIMRVQFFEFCVQPNGTAVW
jgi:hypothetical protein